MKITLVTGNKRKLDEWVRILPENYKIDNQDIDLDEIQSTDPEVIIKHKAIQAYQILRRPLVVEDVSAGLNILKGLPGPFIKHFVKVLGDDALHKLSNSDREPAQVSCTIGYYDGKHLKCIENTIDGFVVPPSGNNGFGFDKVFMPTGTTKTFAEMSSDEKDMHSHRYNAIKKLAEYLEQIS